MSESNSAYDQRFAQVEESIRKLERRAERTEDKMELRDAEYTKKFAEIHTQLAVIDRDVKQISVQVEAGNKQNHDILGRMFDELKCNSDRMEKQEEWMRQVIDREQQSDDELIAKKEEEAQQHSQHVRGMIERFAGWIVAGIMAVWAYFTKG